MSFKDYLLSFFPHRWLDLKSIGNQRLFGGLGAVLDIFDDLVNQIRQESRVSTAVETIPIREAVYEIPINPSLPLDVRRSNILARERENGGPIIKSDLINALRAYGVEVTIQNIISLSEMQIRIEPDYIDVSDFSQMATFVEKVTRAHVGKTWIIPFSIPKPKEIELTTIYRTTINFFDERTLYLDGSWLLDGTYTLSGKETDREVNSGMRLQVSNTNPKGVSGRLIIEKDLWYLDGTYNLDGTKLLDAEIIEEVL